MLKIRFGAALAVLFLSVFFTQTSYANIGQTFGFGSRTATLGGAGVAWGSDGFASYANPAALGMRDEQRLKISYGLIYMQPNFTAINNVVVENNFESNQIRTDNVNMSYLATFGQELGLSYNIFPSFFNLSAGITAYLPLNQVAYMDTGEVFVPEYFMYRARTQRPQVDFAIGGDLGKGFHVGVGFHVGFGLTANSTLTLQTVASKSSDMRFISSLVPKGAPYFGLLFAPEDDPAAYSIGAVFRLPVNSNSTINLNSGFAAFGSLSTLNLIFAATSSLYYDPMALEVGGSFRHPNGRAYAQVDVQFWGAFQSPMMIIGPVTNQNCTPSSPCGVSVVPSQDPSYTYQNIIVPRIGEEFTLNDKVTLRVGYAFQQTVLANVSNGAGNYLDPPKHEFNLGAGVKFKHFLVYDVPTSLDFGFSYQALLTQTITKTAGDENGNTNTADANYGGPKVGSPGYNAGGNVFGGGVSLSMAF